MNSKLGYLPAFADNSIVGRHGNTNEFFAGVPIPSKQNLGKAENRNGIRLKHSKVALRIATEIEKCTSRKNLFEETVSLSCLPKVVANLGMDNPADAQFLANILFALLDVERSGKISARSLPLAIDDILNQARVRNICKFGFNVFSGSKIGRMTKSEMTNIISIFWDGNLDNILVSPGAAVLFYKFLAKEYCGELLEYYLAVLFWNSKKLKSSVLGSAPDRIQDMDERRNRMPLKVANHIVKTYISKDAVKQVNISDKQRNEIIEEVEFSNMIQEKMVPMIIFKDSILEVKSLMESDKTRRFAQEMKSSLAYASFLWKSRSLDQSQDLNLKGFKNLMSKHPAFYKFLYRFQCQVVDLKIKTVEILAKEEERLQSMNLLSNVDDYIRLPSMPDLSLDDI
mmetsp:Transcript_4340/g.5034  ORF Transcript_4340/g.5034 Transcript_4340/m.5034 type:complete len:398 (-) Transcript_4340:1732-2925(-)